MPEFFYILLSKVYYCSQTVSFFYFRKQTGAKKMIKIFSKDKSQPYQSLRNTITSTKYMLNNIWHIKDEKIYLFLKSILSILTAVLPLISVWMSGLIINELTGERRTNALLAYISITTGIPFIQSMIVSTLKIHLKTLQNHLVTTVKINFVSHCANMDLETMENPDIQVLKNVRKRQQ